MIKLIMIMATPPLITICSYSPWALGSKKTVTRFTTEKRGTNLGSINDRLFNPSSTKSNIFAKLLENSDNGMALNLIAIKKLHLSDVCETPHRPQLKVALLVVF